MFCIYCELGVELSAEYTQITGYTGVSEQVISRSLFHDQKGRAHLFGNQE